MKKFFTSMLLVAASVATMQAQQPVWILGNVGDQGWDPSVGTEMTYDATEGVYKFRGDFNPSSYFSFTTALAETSSGWDDIQAYRFGAASDGFIITDDLQDEPIQCGEYGESCNNAFLLTAGGDWEITLELESRMVMFHCYGQGELPDLVGPGMYILGAVNGKSWETNQYTVMESAGGGIYTANVSVADSAATFDFTTYVSPIPSDWGRIAEYRFGSVEDGESLVIGEWMDLGEVGVDNAFSLVQGYYLLTLDMNNRKVKVEEAEPVEGIFIIGNEPFGNWDPAAGVAMHTTDGKIFTYDATINGDCCFIFAGAQGNWDIVNANRYGPESSEEDQEIFADEDIQTQLSTGGKSYKITGDGEYEIVFNKETLVFKFASKGGIPEDVNNDGVVDVSDLNIVINVALGKETLEANPRADITGDGTVDVSDINLVVNAMLKS